MLRSTQQRRTIRHRAGGRTPAPVCAARIRPGAPSAGTSRLRPSAGARQTAPVLGARQI